LPFEGSSGEDTRVGAIVRTDVPTCRIGERLAGLPASARDWGLCVVTNQEGCVTGVIRSGAFALGPETLVEQAMAPGPSTVRPSTRRADLARDVAERRLPYVLVTTPFGELIGLVRADDL
jgi:CBS domain-containing protein